MPPNIDNLSEQDLDLLLKGDFDNLSEDAINLLSSQIDPEAAQFKLESQKPITERVIKPMLYSGARQVGTLTRGGLQGLEDLGNLVATPIREGMNIPTYISNIGVPDEEKKPLPVQPLQVAEKISDFIGLPQPETTAEKLQYNVGQFASPTKALASGAAKVVPKAGGAMDALKKSFTTQLPQQISGSMGAGLGFGLADQTIPEEAGGFKTGAQFLTSLAGGLIGAKAPQGVKDVGSNVKYRFNEFRDAPNAALTKTVTTQLNNIVKNNKAFANIQQGTLNSVTGDIVEARLRGFDLTEPQIMRLLDYRMAGLTPTKGRITQTASEVTKEKNLQKIGANSDNPNAQKLAAAEQENQQIINQLFDDLGASSGKGIKDSGDELFTKLEAINSRKNQIIDDMYNNARTIGGEEALLDGANFTNNILNKLKVKQRYLPKEIADDLARYKDNKVFTIAEKNEFQSIVAADLRKAKLAGDGNRVNALMEVRNELENVQFLKGQQFGKETLKAFNDAKKVTYEYKQLQKKIPALGEMDKPFEKQLGSEQFFNKFIIGETKEGSVANVKRLMDVLDDESKVLVKNNTLNWIKSNAFKNDKLSSAGLNKAMNKLGNKLNVIFSPDEIDQIRRLQRLSNYEQGAPAGSAINYSGSGALSISEMAKRFIPSPIQNVQREREILGQFDIGKILRDQPLFEQPSTPRFQTTQPYQGLLLNRDEM